MKARDATRKMPVTVSADATVSDVAELMDRRAVGAVIVTDDERPTGIVTDRDLAVRVLARRLPPDARVDSVMSTDVMTLPANADLREAMRLFADHPIRRLPLVDGGRLIGVLTMDDLMVDVISDLTSLVRPVTGQVLFGHPEPKVPAEAS
ncbi:MAG TPA: CBS domain-containing protein [Acidimicrobiales bacterium]|nr:CBS domain-containing protein [Acidimicrobiales bacterium]